MPPKRNVKPANDEFCMPSAPFDVTPEASPEPCDADDMYEEHCEEVSDEEEECPEMETLGSSHVASDDELENVSVDASSYASSPDKSFFFGRKAPPVKMTIGIPVEFDLEEEYVV
jgi:hypothetical protein